MSAHVVASVERALHLGALDTLSSADLAHLAHCPDCRGGMLLLAATLGLAPSPAFPACTCEGCESGLAAFIELERGDPAAAARADPATWWHLWACPSCAETYRLTQLMVDAADRGDFPPLPAPR